MNPVTNVHQCSLFLFSMADDNPDINPYATFNELKLVFSEPPAYHKPDTDYSEYSGDSISLEKAEAQKAVSLPQTQT